MFPVRMRIMPGCVFNAKDPIVLGVEIMEGQLRIGSPVCVGKDLIDLGRVAGLERDHKAVDKAEAYAAPCTWLFVSIVPFYLFFQ